MSALRASPLVPHLAYAIQDLLLKQRGVLHGRTLYQEYGETETTALLEAIRWLEEARLVSVRGNLDAPLGVFHAVLVTR